MGFISEYGIYIRVWEIKYAYTHLYFYLTPIVLDVVLVNVKK